jgi:hypothetical protein
MAQTGLSRFLKRLQLFRVVLAKTAQTGLSCFGKNGSNRFEPFWTKTTLNN